MIRCTFPDGTKIEGEDEKSVLDAWNALPWWADYSPGEFREAIVRLTGAEIDGGLPAADEEILPAVAEADPELRYEPAASPTIGGLAARAGTALPR